MIVSGFRRFLTGFQAFANDSEYKSKVAEILFDLGDHFAAKYEKLGDGFSVDAQEDSLLLATRGRQFLLSRQTPSRQIWFASPISGSIKFDYDNVAGHWIDHKQPAVDIRSSIEHEIEALFTRAK
jgi:frataxin-like iron-binding protein CyaY